MFEQAFKNIDNVLWKDAGCTSELDYTEQSSWLLFLKYLDGLEEEKATTAALHGKQYTYVSEGVQELDTDKLAPLLILKYQGSITDAVADLGKAEEIGKAFSGFQKYLY